MDFELNIASYAIMAIGTVLIGALIMIKCTSMTCDKTKTQTKYDA